MNISWAELITMIALVALIAISIGIVGKRHDNYEKLIQQCMEDGHKEYECRLGKVRVKK